MEQYKNLISYALKGDAVKFKEGVYNLLGGKLHNAMEAKKNVVAQNIFKKDTKPE